MKRTSAVCGLVFSRSMIMFGKREARSVALADSAGQTLITPKMAAHLLQDTEFKSHVERVVGVGQISYDIPYFTASVSVGCKKNPLADFEVSTADVSVGIIPGLDADVESDRSGISMFLGYDAMQALGVVPNTAQVDQDGNHFLLKLDTVEPSKIAHYALNPDKVRVALDKFIKTHKDEFDKDDKEKY